MPAEAMVLHWSGLPPRGNLAMMPLRTALSVSAAIAITSLPASAQVTRYGLPTPSGFGVELTNGPFQSFAGNANFQLRLTGPNPFGGGLFIALSRASLPLGNWTLLLDPLSLQAETFPLPPGTVSQSLPLPFDPATFGVPVDFQALLATNGGTGIGATNAAEVRIQRFRTPMRGYFPGADLSQGQFSQGQFATMDLSIWPPAFRATADVGYSGMTGETYPVAVAVSERLDYAFLHGNRSFNPFIRILDIRDDPAGVVTYRALGDIYLANGPVASMNHADLEVSRDGRWLFCTTGDNQIELLVFDISGLPGTIPTAPVQSFIFPIFAIRPSSAILDISPDNRLLALCLSASPTADVVLFDVTATAQPLVPRASLIVPGSSGTGSPSAIDFSPNSTRLFVVTGGTFSYYDVAQATPTALIANSTWWPNTFTFESPTVGGTLAELNGRTVAIAAEGGSTAPGPFYHLIDLAEPPGPTFGTIIQRFSPEPSTHIPGNPIPHGRLHSLGNIVIAIQGSTTLGYSAQVIDLSVLDPVTGFKVARVQMPSSGRLSPQGNSCIAFPFELR